MVWLRMVTSAGGPAGDRPPAWRGRSRGDWLVVAGFGVNLGLMNWAIYQSIARIPLGIAVTIEFIGPLTLAVARLAPGARPGVGAAGRRSGWCCWASSRPTSTWPESRSRCWPGRPGRRTSSSARGPGQRWPGLDGLAVASIVRRRCCSPARRSCSGGTALLDPHVLLLGALVGLLSSVIPYSCELVALRTIAPSVFAILMSLEPAAAALAAIVVLEELLSPAAVAGPGVRRGRQRRRHPLAGPVPRRARCRTERRTARPVDHLVRHNLRMEKTTAGRGRPTATPRVRFVDVLSDDGTRLRAWTNDPDGTIDGPTVVLCNGLGTSAVGVAGAARPRLRRPRRLLEPPRHRRLGAARRPQPGPHRGVRRGRAVGDGPLRRRPRRADGLVDGRQHHVRAGRRATPSGSPACSPSAACPATRSPPCSARSTCPTAWPGSLTVNLSRAMRLRRPGAHRRSPAGCPSARRAIAALEPHRLHAPAADPELSAPRDQGVPRARPSDGTSTSRSTPPSTPASPSAGSTCRPSSSPARTTCWPVPATWPPPPRG